MISLYFFTLSSLQPQVLFQQNSSSLNFPPFFLLCFLWYTREWDSWVPRCQRSHVPDLSDGILVQTLLKLMPIPTVSHPKSVQSEIGLTSCGRPASGLMGTHTHLFWDTRELGIEISERAEDTRRKNDKERKANISTTFPLDICQFSSCGCKAEKQSSF